MGGDEQDFKGEYAKSGRASCKACSMTINKDSLRLAIMVQSRHFDGKQPNWHHFDCFWQRAKPQSHVDFGGFDSLRWDDQKKIKDRIGGAGDGAKSSKSGKSSSSSSGFDYKDYTTEYAKSGASTCKNCENKIPKNELRLSKKNYYSQRAMAYGPYPDWYHVDCFLAMRDDLEFGSDKDVKKFYAFPNLKKEDKETLIEKFGKVTAAPKRKAESAAGSKAAKVSKESNEESPEEKTLRKQNETYWKCRDTLEKLVTNNALKGLLEYNKQDLPSGESRLLNRVADCMTFGALDKCPECKEGQLVFSSSGYHCLGNISGWTKCQYTTKMPKRNTFKIPEEFHDVDYLAKYKCNKQTRLLPKDGAAASSAAAALNETKSISNADKPLQNLKFVILGKVSNKKKIEAAILDLGGTVSPKLDLNIAACISTKAEVDKDSSKVQEARGLNIRILNEEFLKDVKGTTDLQATIKSHCLSYWGEFTKSAPMKSVAKIKSAARDAAMFAKSGPSKIKMTVKDGSVVDPESGLQSNYHVLKEGKDFYSEVLNMVDVQKGTNSYYKLQVLESDSGKSYYVFRSWGRVGTRIGGDKKEAFYVKQRAIDNFKEVYLDKSGNDWEDRKDFVKRPNRFYPIEMDYGDNDEKIKSLSDAGSKSKLDKSIQDIVRMIFDVDSMKKALVEFEIDLKKMPLGKISKKQIEKAYRVLTEVQNFLKDGGTPTQFLDCSNRFYTLIPHDFGMEKPPLLDNEKLLKTKTSMCGSLLEIEVAYSLMKSGDDTGKDPIDHHYEQLKTEFEVLPKDGEEYKRLLEYVKNTHGGTHSFQIDVEDIFAIKREKEASRYKPFKRFPNRMLLWHGSGTANYAGILSQGLRIAPPEAPVTGYMFGKGVYFADMATKSANYCRITTRNPTGIMILCEVALGTMYECRHAQDCAKLRSGYHSCKGIGSTCPDPAANYTAPNGSVYPMGKAIIDPAIGKTDLLYNEFIVYDTAQINMKYLLKISIKRDY